MGHLALPVRTRCGNTILVHAYTADTECRVGTDAADGDLLILGVVISIAGQKTGDGGQIVGEVYSQGIIA